MYLYFAVTWILGGVGILIWHALEPGTTQGKIGGISLGWVALLLGLYNLARWWSWRSNRTLRRADQEARAVRRREPRAPAAPDPDGPFNFDQR